MEIIKAEVMYNIHLRGGIERDTLLDEVKNRFEKIYKSISMIENSVDEDDVLRYTTRIYFESLMESSPLEKIHRELSSQNSVILIKNFSRELAVCFDALTAFFGKDKANNPAVYSLAMLGEISFAFPFIIKAYKFGLNIDVKGELCTSLESIIVRHRLIGTRADINARFNEVFRGFTTKNSSIEPIVKLVLHMKSTSELWWAYWNDSELNRSLQGAIGHNMAKFLLWKYEGYLVSLGPEGYPVIRFEDIKDGELEHIAPVTEPDVNNNDYDNYDEEFRQQYLECLGNYLLLSKSNNCAVGNRPFAEKRLKYTQMAHHREVANMVEKNGKWNRIVIKKRKDKIVTFLTGKF